MPQRSDALKSFCHSSVLFAAFATFCVAGVCAQNEEVAVDTAISDANTVIDADSLGNPTVRGISDADVIQRAEVIERCLSGSFNKYASLNRLIDDFQFWQRFMLPIAPPAADQIFYAQHDKFRVFDPTGFPMQVLSGLVPEFYRDAVDVYRVTVCEDPVTRDRVIYNANNEEIWRQPPPENYNPWFYLERVQSWTLRSRTTETRNLDVIYNPARICCEYLLMPVDNLPEYALAMAIESLTRAMEMTANPPAMMMNAYVPASDEFVFTDLIVTGGMVDVETHLPDGIACRVDLFQSSVLPGFPWSLLTTTPTNSGTIHIQCVCTLSNAFFRAGNADIDTDGDGIPDDREILMYGTNPYLADSDGDGLSDYDELFVYNTNPLLRDSDGDGTDDDEQVRAGNNHVASSTSIRFYYDADDRVTGAYSGVPTGSALYSVLPDGNHTTITERRTP